MAVSENLKKFSSLVSAFEELQNIKVGLSRIPPPKYLLLLIFSAKMFQTEIINPIKIGILVENYLTLKMSSVQ